MKWILIIIALAIGFAVYTGYMGGAKSATGNYINVKNIKGASDF